MGLSGDLGRCLRKATSNDAQFLTPRIIFTSWRTTDKQNKING